MRALATLRVVKDLQPIEGADKIELAIVDGWQCVVKKDEFKVNELVVYFEIDSFIPHALAPFLSRGKEPREFEGVKGERLRTIKLRGALSQGLVLSLEHAWQHIVDPLAATEGDVTEALGIKKWERPMNPQLAGMARGNFPDFIPKTDQERIQNMFGSRQWHHHIDDDFEVTLKMDGSSCTFYIKDDHVGVCSRNLELLTDESNAHNAFVAMFNKLGMREKLQNYRVQAGGNIAIQGELWGAGINGNHEGISDIRFNMFDAYDIDRQEYLKPAVRRMLAADLGLDHVRLDDEFFTISDQTSVDWLLQDADKYSVYNKVAEGLVYKSNQRPEFSFKVINNKFLLNGGE
jgi:RNA ligase (TIGR02306 family)